MFKIIRHTDDYYETLLFDRGGVGFNYDKEIEIAYSKVSDDFELILRDWNNYDDDGSTISVSQTLDAEAARTLRDWLTTYLDKETK